MKTPKVNKVFGRRGAFSHSPVGSITESMAANKKSIHTKPTRAFHISPKYSVMESSLDKEAGWAINWLFVGKCAFGEKCAFSVDVGIVSSSVIARWKASFRLRTESYRCAGSKDPARVIT